FLSSFQPGPFFRRFSSKNRRFFNVKLLYAIFTPIASDAIGGRLNYRYENKNSIQRSVRNDLQRRRPLLFAAAPPTAPQPRRGLVPAHAPGRRARRGLGPRPRAEAGANLVCQCR